MKKNDQLSKIRGFLIFQLSRSQNVAVLYNSFMVAKLKELSYSRDDRSVSQV